MIYRPGEPQDHQNIKALLTASFDRHYAYYAHKSFESLENTLLAEEGSDMLGVVNWRIFQAAGKKLGYVFWLAVDPKHRGQSVGTRLVEKTVELIWQDIAIEDIYVTIDKDNGPSQNLFDKAGFRSVSRYEMKKKYHIHRFRLFKEMMFMPWENLYCLTREACN